MAKNSNNINKEITPVDVYNSLSASDRKCKRNMKEMLDTFRTEIYDIGYKAGYAEGSNASIAEKANIEEVQTAQKTQLDKIIHAIYLDYPKSAAYKARVVIKYISGYILYDGRACDMPKKLRADNYVIVSIVPLEDTSTTAIPAYNATKVITVA